MAVTKLQKPTTDSPVGFQTINTFVSNVESFKTDFEKEHAPDRLIAPVPGSLSIFENFPQDAASILVSEGGAHDSPLIPRGAAAVVATSADVFDISTYDVSLVKAHGALTTMQVLGTGVYFFPMDGFAEVWGRATPRSQTGSTFAWRFPVDAKVQPDVSGLLVRTFRLQNPDAVNDIMYPFHTGFFLVAYGRRGSASSVPGGTRRRDEGLSPDPMDPGEDAG